MLLNWGSKVELRVIWFINGRNDIEIQMFWSHVLCSLQHSRLVSLTYTHNSKLTYTYTLHATFTHTYLCMHTYICEGIYVCVYIYLHGIYKMFFLIKFYIYIYYMNAVNKKIPRNTILFIVLIAFTAHPKVLWKNVKIVTYSRKKKFREYKMIKIGKSSVFGLA